MSLGMHDVREGETKNHHGAVKVGAMVVPARTSIYFHPWYNEM